MHVPAACSGVPTFSPDRFVCARTDFLEESSSTAPNRHFEGPFLDTKPPSEEVRGKRTKQISAPKMLSGNGCSSCLGAPAASGSAVEWRRICESDADAWTVLAVTFSPSCCTMTTINMQCSRWAGTSREASPTFYGL